MSKCIKCNIELTDEHTNEFFCNKCLKKQFESDYEIQELKKQLAEKDEEIERQKSVVEFYKSYYTGFHERLVDELLKLNNEILSIESVPKNNSSAMDMKLSVVDLIDEKISKIREVK